MKIAAIFVLLACFSTSCVPRIALYAPHRNPTDEHRAAPDNAACRSCHEASLPKSHAVDDDCMNCHKLCRGC